MRRSAREEEAAGVYPFLQAPGTLGGQPGSGATHFVPAHCPVARGVFSFPASQSVLRCMGRAQGSWRLGLGTRLQDPIRPALDTA